MPFLSKKQMAWGNSPAGIKALGGKDKVQEWNAATNQKTLPLRVPKIKLRGSMAKLAGAK